MRLYIIQKIYIPKYPTFSAPSACTGSDIHKVNLISIYGVDYIISIHPWVHACEGVLYEYNGGGIKGKDQELREL